MDTSCCMLIRCSPSSHVCASATAQIKQHVYMRMCLSCVLVAVKRWKAQKCVNVIFFGVNLSLSPSLFLCMFFCIFWKHTGGLACDSLSRRTLRTYMYTYIHTYMYTHILTESRLQHVVSIQERQLRRGLHPDLPPHKK